MARVLFVQDNGVNENLGLMSIAAVLREAGHQVELLLTEEHGKRFVPLVAAFQPDLIGLSFMTGSRQWARVTASRRASMFFFLDVVRRVAAIRP